MEGNMKTEENIFRDDVIKKMDEVDELNDYIIIAKPPVWLFLVASVLITIGLTVWGAYGYIDTTIDARISCDKGKVYSYDDLSTITKDMKVKIGDDEYTIISIDKDNEANESKYSMVLSRSIGNGDYDTKIVTNREHPIKFLFN